MKTIALTAGLVAKIDEGDFDLVDRYVWSAEARGHTHYAVCYLDPTDLTRCIRMHRLLMNPPADMVVDHIDGDGLNNQRSNLRVCTKAENGRNRRKQRTRAEVSSKYKGVSWDKTNRKWRARIVVGGRQRHLGNFADEEAAARAYNHAAEDCFGRFAKLNQVEPIADSDGEAA